MRCPLKKTSCSDPTPPTRDDMSNEENIPAGHTDFENTLTPEEAEEFDRLAEKLAPKKRKVTRDELVQRTRDLRALVAKHRDDVIRAYAEEGDKVHASNTFGFCKYVNAAIYDLQSAVGELAMAYQEPCVDI